MASPYPFQNKVAVVSGAASGIGLSTALYLAARGAILSIADIKEKELATVAEAIKEANPSIKIITTTVDVRKQEQVDNWISKTVKVFGRIDCAANICGVYGSSNGLVKTKNEDWDYILGVNLTGVMYCMRAQAKVMRGGSIVNTASIAGIRSAGLATSYGASKYGVVGLTTSAAKELGSQNIRVNCVCPGTTATPMLEMAKETTAGSENLTLKIPLGRIGKPEEIASAIAFLLGDESTYITGTFVTIDGGMSC